MASEPDNFSKRRARDAGEAADLSAKAAEKHRLAEALRENLRRRKAQRQARTRQDPDEPAG